MRYKKIMMLTIILAFLLGVSTVSASNNSTSNIVTLEETTEDIMGVENNQVILEKYDGGNFLKFSNDENTLDSDNSYSNLTKSDDNEIYSYMYYCRLSSDIEKTTRYSTLKLQNDYYFGSAKDESEIEISKPITLDGNGHILNGRGVASGFYITSGEVTLKNIKFKNCRPSDSYSSIGGAIIIGESVSGSITIDNCSFYNNKASDYGGAICCQSDNVRLTIKNSYFEGNEAINGGAIYVDSFGKTVYVDQYLDINNCTFKLNKANYGSIVYFNLGESKKVTISSCNFYKCGYAIYGISSGGTISKSLFVDNLIYWETSTGTISSCTFNNTYIDKSCTPILKNNIIIKRNTVFSVSKNYFNNMKIFVKDQYGNLLLNKVITLRFDNSSYEYLYNTGSYGYFSPNMNFSLNSNHTIHVAFGGDDYNIANNDKCTFSILPSIIFSETQDFVSEGKKCNVTYWDGNEWISYSYIIPYGYINQNFTNPFTGEEIYKEFSVLNRIQENNDLIIDYMDVISFTVKALDNFDKYSANQKIKFKVAGKTYFVNTDENGFATLKMHLKYGRYIIEVYHGKVVVKNMITVKPIYIYDDYGDMSLKSISMYYGENKKLSYSWNGFFKGVLKIYEGSTLKGSVNLDTSKYIGDYYEMENYMDYFEVKNWLAGKYDVKIIDSRGKMVKSATINVLKVPSKIIINGATVISGTKHSMVVKLKDSKFNKNLNGNVVVKINGKKYNVKIKNGMGKFNYKAPSKVKKYICSAIFKGNNNIKDSVCYFKLNVNPIPIKTSVKAPSIKVKYGKNSKFAICVEDKKGRSIKNLKLKVKISSKYMKTSYSLKTNSKGFAYFNTIDLDIGTTQVYITSPNIKYEVSKNSKIIVKKIATPKKKSSSKKITLKFGNSISSGKYVKGAYVYAAYGDIYGPYVRTDSHKSFNRIKFIKANVYFKNNYDGNFKVKTKKLNKWGMSKTNLISGYRPYKVVIFYK